MLSMTVALVCVTRVGLRTVGSTPAVKNTSSTSETLEVPIDICTYEADWVRSSYYILLSPLGVYGFFPLL